MKNINKISIFLLALVLLFSCEEKLQTLDAGSFFVRFQTAGIDLIEGTSTLKIPVTLGSPAQSTAVEIQYEISGTAVEGVDYSFASTKGTLSIPAGSFADTVRLNILDDLETDGVKDLVLTLTSVSNGLNPGIGTLGKELKVSIADNDCPFVAAEYVGAYSLKMELANGFIFAAGTYDIDASLVLGPEENTLVDPDFGYLSASARTPVPVAIKINPTGPTTVTLGSAFTFGDGSSVTDAVFAYGTTPNRRFYTGDGFGVLSSCAKSFTVKALIRREDGSIGQILNLTYTKK